MSLVKISKISGTKTKRAPSGQRVAIPTKMPASRAGKITNGSQSDKVSEGVAAATEELASGLTEASAAAEELRRSMENPISGVVQMVGFGLGRSKMLYLSREVDCLPLRRCTALVVSDRSNRQQNND